MKSVRLAVASIAMILSTGCDDGRCRDSVTSIGSFEKSHVMCNHGASLSVRQVGPREFAVCTCGRDGGR